MCRAQCLAQRRQMTNIYSVNIKEWPLGKCVQPSPLVLKTWAGVGHSEWPQCILVTDHLFSLNGVWQQSYGLYL